MPRLLVEMDTGVILIQLGQEHLMCLQLLTGHLANYFQVRSLAHPTIGLSQFRWKQECSPTCALLHHPCSSAPHSNSFSLCVLPGASPCLCEFCFVQEQLQHLESSSQQPVADGSKVRMPEVKTKDRRHTTDDLRAADFEFITEESE